jgi:uncharacterized repeat protein (TIGR03833 family)
MYRSRDKGEYFEVSSNIFKSNIFAQQNKEKTTMNGKNRKDIKPGIKVMIVLKKDQRTGKLTEGIVKDILTNSQNHPHGIKVRLESGDIGRVQKIISED